MLIRLRRRAHRRSSPMSRLKRKFCSRTQSSKSAVEKLKLDQRPEYQPSGSFWGRALSIIAERTVCHRRGQEEPESRAFPGQPDRADFLRRARPAVASDFVNTLAQTVIDQSVDARRQAAREINEWLRPRIQELKSKFDNSEAALDAYTRSAGLVLTEGQDNLAADRLRTMQDELARAQADRIAKQAAIGTNAATIPRTRRQRTPPSGTTRLS